MLTYEQVEQWQRHADRGGFTAPYRFIAVSKVLLDLWANVPDLVDASVLHLSKQTS